MNHRENSEKDLGTSLSLSNLAQIFEICMRDARMLNLFIYRNVHHARRAFEIIKIECLVYGRGKFELFCDTTISV